MTLQATLLGDVRFRFGGAAIEPTSRKGTALLAFLCLRSEGAKREDLAELLWGPGRLANLRQELYALRRLPGSDDWLCDNGDVIAVRATTDVGALDDADNSPDLVRETARQEMAAATGGELLPGLERIEAPAFLDWLDLERRRVAELLLRHRRDTAERLSGQGRHDEALAVLSTALEVDPLDERLVRAAMRIAYDSGDAGAALARCEEFRRQAREELGLGPSPETLELEARIKRGEPLVSVLEFDRIGADLKGLAQAVAVAAGSLDVELLARVLERKPLDVAADLARLERGGWLDENLLLVPQAVDSVKAGTPAVVRRLLHRRVAETLNDSPAAEPGTVAVHLLAAERAGEAAPLLVRAAQQAIDKAALDEAVELLLRALWAGSDIPELRLEAALLLEGCAGQLGDEGLQDAALAEAESLAWGLQTDRGLADVRMRRSRTLLRRGRAGEGLEAALEALEIATRLGDEQLVARARNAVGGAQFYVGDVDGAELSFTQNSAAADPIERYRARNNLGSIAGVRGRTREALAHLEEALTLGRAVGERASIIGTLNNVAATAERVGDYRRAVKYFKEGLALARQTGSLVNEGQLLANLSVVYSRLGELGPAWNTALEVEDLAEEQGNHRLRMLAHEQRSEVSILCGDVRGAQVELETAEGLASTIGDERKESAFAVSRSVVEARAGSLAAAKVEAQLEALAEPKWADVTPWLWLELAMVADDPDSAERRLDKAGALTGENSHLGYLVDLGRLRAGLLEGASAAHHDAAEAAFERLSSAAHPGRESDYVQAPQARLLCACWQAGTSAEADGAQEATVERVRSDLLEQAAGLPKRLRTSLQEQPRHWLSGLRTNGLTLD